MSQIARSVTPKYVENFFRNNQETIDGLRLSRFVPPEEGVKWRTVFDGKIYILAQKGESYVVQLLSDWQNSVKSGCEVFLSGRNVVLDNNPETKQVMANLICYVQSLWILGNAKSPLGEEPAPRSASSSISPAPVCSSTSPASSSISPAPRPASSSTSPAPLRPSGLQASFMPPFDFNE